MINGNWPIKNDVLLREGPAIGSFHNGFVYHLMYFLRAKRKRIKPGSNRQITEASTCCVAKVDMLVLRKKDANDRQSSNFSVVLILIFDAVGSRKMIMR